MRTPQHQERVMRYSAINRRSMSRLAIAFVPVVIAAAAVPAQAFVFTLTPVTTTTPNFTGLIQIQGSVTVASNETFLSPNLVSTFAAPFLPGFAAGFTAGVQNFDPAFLAWNGVGTYIGPIYFFQNSPSNLGFSGGMPLGLYNVNIFGPNAQPGIILSYAGPTGATQSAAANYAINVVPTPGAAAVLALGGLMAGRRRRS